MVRCDGSHSIHDAVGHVQGDIYVTFKGLFAAVAFAATTHCTYIAGSVVVQAMWTYLDGGSVMFALRHGVGQYGVRATGA